jgi:hypothetical protein
MVGEVIRVLIFVIYIGIIIYVISLLGRVTKAIEKIAAKIENSPKL